MIKHCPACNIKIQKKSNQWLKQIYCSTKCRKMAHRKKKSQTTRIDKKRANMRQNDEVLYLVRQCKRAKTVQILEGHNADSFIETMAFIRNKPKLDIHICHIAPVKGKESTGLFHCQNLFYGGSYQNKKFGNKSLGGGLKIKNEDILEKWSLSEEASTNEVLLKIEQYLGDIISEYIKSSPIRKSKKAQVANKIIDIDPRNNFDDLIQLSYNELIESWNTISKQTKPKINYNTTESKYITYMNELSRFLSYSEDGDLTLKKLIKTMAIGYIALRRANDSRTYNKDFELKYGNLVKKYRKARLKHTEDWSEFKDLIYNAAFKTLQGGTLKANKFHREILEYLNLSTDHALS